jgi:hypothetical protein
MPSNTCYYVLWAKMLQSWSTKSALIDVYNYSVDRHVRYVYVLYIV